MLPQFPSKSASRYLFRQIKSEDRWRGVYFPALQMSISDFLVISQIARDGRRLACVFIRQCEDVERIATLRMVHIRFYHAGNVAWTAAAKPCGDSDVLFPANAERYGKALYRRAEPSLPEDLTGVDVQGSKVPVQITHKRQSAAGGQYRRQESRPLIMRPDFFHRFHVECR